MLYKFIHANFYKRQGIHVTLTYSVPQYDDKEVYHDFKIFWQKLRYYYPNLGYISVLEPHQSGAWHIHLLLRDVTSNKIFVGYEDIRSFWNHGFCYVSNMKSNEDYGWYFKKKIKPDNPLLKYYKEGVRYHFAVNALNNENKRLWGGLGGNTHFRSNIGEMRKPLERLVQAAFFGCGRRTRRLFPEQIGVFVRNLLEVTVQGVL